MYKYKERNHMGLQNICSKINVKLIHRNKLKSKGSQEKTNNTGKNHMAPESNILKVTFKDT